MKQKKAAKTKKRPVKVLGEHAFVKEITEDKHPSGLPKGTIIRRALKPSDAHLIKGKPGEARIARLRGDSVKKYQISQTLAHLLFPKDVPEVLASSKKGYRAYSKKVNLDSKSRDAVDEYYKEVWKGWRHSKEYNKHRGRAASEQVAKRFAKIHEAGIRVETHPVNIGFSNNKPVFFEIAEVNITKAEKYVETA